MWGANVALGVVFPLHLVLLLLEEVLGTVQDTFFNGAQLDRNFTSATGRGFSATAAASNLYGKTQKKSVTAQICKK